jgi:uncharacterized protein YutE (UPF0331/DUF86 family)
MKIENAESALARLREVLSRDLTDEINRDAALLRFQVALEAVSHAAAVALDDQLGLNAPSPRAAVRDSRRAGWIDQATAELLLNAVDDRNRLAHTYSLDRAIEVTPRLARYGDAMATWLAALGED